MSEELEAAEKVWNIWDDEPSLFNRPNHVVSARISRRVLAAMKQVREQTLEEAAKLCASKVAYEHASGGELAEAIRKLKERP